MIRYEILTNDNDPLVDEALEFAALNLPHTIRWPFEKMTVTEKVEYIRSTINTHKSYEFGEYIQCALKYGHHTVGFETYVKMETTLETKLAVWLKGPDGSRSWLYKPGRYDDAPRLLRQLGCKELTASMHKGSPLEDWMKRRFGIKPVGERMEYHPFEELYSMYLFATDTENLFKG